MTEKGIEIGSMTTITDLQKELKEICQQMPVKYHFKQRLKK